MAVKKKKPRLNKKTKKVLVKKKRRIRVKKENPYSGSDIIFDSKMGDTDALFVDEPNLSINEVLSVAEPKNIFWQKILFFKKRK